MTKYIETLPVHVGDIITIHKGTKIKTVFHGERLAGKTYKIKIDHILPGMNDFHHTPISNPEIRWAGSGGYWSSVDINDIQVPSV